MQYITREPVIALIQKRPNDSEIARGLILVPHGRMRSLATTLDPSAAAGQALIVPQTFAFSDSELIATQVCLLKG